MRTKGWDHTGAPFNNKTKNDSTWTAYFVKQTRTRTWTQTVRKGRLEKKRTLYQNSLYELKTHFWQIWGCLFQTRQYFFQILFQKYPNKAILVPNLGIFFRKILQLDKFEVADFEYDNRFLKFYPENIQIRDFWSRIFVFLTKFCSWANSRMLISNITILFSNSTPNIPKSKYFCTKLCNSTSLRTLISNMTIFSIYSQNFATAQIWGWLILKTTILFSNSSLKTAKWGVFCPKFKDFYFFATNFAIRQVRGCWLQIWQ